MDEKIMNEFITESQKAFEGLKSDIKQNADNTDKVRKELEEFKKEWSELKASSSRPFAPDIKNTDKEKSKKFWQALKTGDLQTLAEFKSMNAGSDAAGGYIMPTERLAEIKEKAVQYCPMMELASVIQISQGDVIEIPLEGDALGVAITSETASRTETSTANAFSLARISVYDYEARPLVTNKLLADALFDLESYITKKITEQIMVDFGSDCVVGTGSGEPTGFTAMTGVGSVLSGSAGALSLATIPKLLGAVKPAYRKNGKWACNGTTWGIIAGLAITGGYQPIIGYNAQSGRFTLLNQDVVEMSELPDIGASAYPLWYGDWNQACTVIQRADIEVLRNPYVSMGFTYFYTKMRLGFYTTTPEAIAKMKSNNS